MTYDAILLVSFGGPEGPEEVMPYLERVTAGRGVPRERLEEVSHHYLALGGVSPINAQNRELLAHLARRLPERGVSLPIYWGNRNSAPFFADVIREMYDNGHRKVLAFVTSAYSSYSGCRQYRENLYEALAVNNLVGSMRIDKIRHYFDHPGFLAPVINGVAASIESMRERGLAPHEIDVMFATHSIPESMGIQSGPPALRSTFAQPGGAYEAQHRAAAELVMAAVTEPLGDSTPSWQLVYQSRSGSPQVPWLEPDINDAIALAHDEGKKGVVVVPIGFVSDHVEVIWDLDNEAKESAEAVGLTFSRVATPGTHSAFIDAIADLVLERVENAPVQALSALGPWPDSCAAGCCPNLRHDLPVIAEET